MKEERAARKAAEGRAETLAERLKQMQTELGDHDCSLKRRNDQQRFTKVKKGLKVKIKKPKRPKPKGQHSLLPLLFQKKKIKPRWSLQNFRRRKATEAFSMQ